MAAASGSGEDDVSSSRFEYEVKCPQTWAWYPANITDYDPKTQKFLIKYPDDWKAESWESGNEIRAAGKPFPSSWRPNRDEHCECKAKAEENEPFGWWGCQVKSVRDEPNGNNIVYIQFDGWPEEHNEMLELEYLRPKNNSKAINAPSGNGPSSNNNNNNNKTSSIVKEVMDVADYAKDWVMDPRQNNLNNLKKRLIAISFNENTNKLTLIGTGRRVQQVKGIIELQFVKQQSLYEKKQKLAQDEARVKQNEERERNAAKTKFKVHPLLSGYLIGKDRLNTTAVRDKIKGVVRINLKHGECEIACDTKEALTEAVDMLQIVAKKVILPKREMAPIIGKKGEDIRALKSNVEVIRIISWSRFPEEYLRLKARHDDRNAAQSRPNTAENGENETKEGGNKGRRNRGRGRNQGNSDEMNGNFNEYSGPEDLRDILKRYGVKIKNVRQNGESFETRIYPDSLEDEIHSFFENESEDVVELLTEDEKKEGIDEDALVIIGKKLNVRQCISMIMLQLNHIRKINGQKQRIRDLYAKLRDIKGYISSPRDRSGDYNQQQGDDFDGRRDNSNNNNNRRGPPMGATRRDNNRNNNNNNNNANNKKGSKGKGGKGKNNRRDDDYDSKDENSFGPRTPQRQGGGFSQPKTSIGVRRRIKPQKPIKPKVKKDNKEGKDESVENDETATPTTKPKNKKRRKKPKSASANKQEESAPAAQEEQAQQESTETPNDVNQTANNNDDTVDNTPDNNTETNDNVDRNNDTTETVDNRNVEGENDVNGGNVGNDDGNAQGGSGKKKRRRRRKNKGGAATAENE